MASRKPELANDASISMVGVGCGLQALLAAQWRVKPPLAVQLASLPKSVMGVGDVALCVM
jgi:hypothetical protein